MSPDAEKVNASQAARPVPDVNELSDAEIERLYGAWARLSPSDAFALLRDAPFRSWVAGGWAVEVATQTNRHHWDTDVVVLRRDLELVREWFSEFHLWEVHEGTMRPLLAGASLSPDREQLWLRRDAMSPWLLDLLITPTEGNDWLYKRNHAVRRPLDDIGFTLGDVPFLKPALVLLFKAKAHRAKDDADLQSLLPILLAEERQWLADALGKESPEHPWLSALGA